MAVEHVLQGSHPADIAVGADCGNSTVATDAVSIISIAATLPVD
jgi:hypothetical protein